MRVLHVGKYFPPRPGGIENFTADLLAALTQSGVDAAALVHEQAGTEAQTPWPRTHPSGFPIYTVPTYGQLLYAPVSPAFPVLLARAIEHFKPDILHFHFPNTSAMWALLLPAARRLPWVVHWHSDVVPSRIRPALRLAYGCYRPFEQAFLARTTLVVATSPPYLASSEPLSRWRNKCEVIPLGLDPERVTVQSPAMLDWASDIWCNGGLRLLSLGRLTYYKGIEVLLEAVAPVTDVCLILVGDGPLRSRLAAKANKLGLDDRVLMLGHRETSEVNALLETCNVLCLPSIERTEAFGLVLLEAMCRCKPVIASDITGSGVRWVIDDGRCGALVSVGDAAALRQALRELAAHPPRRRKMAEAGYRRFESTFHISSVSARLIESYERIYPLR